MNPLNNKLDFLDIQKIGVSTNLFHTIRFSDSFAAISRLAESFSTIELELEYGFKRLLNAVSKETLDRESIEVLKRLKQLKADRPLSLSLHAPYIGSDCDLAAEDEDQRSRSCRLLMQSIELCAALDVRRLTYHPGFRSASTLEASLDRLKRSLAWLVPVAADHKIELCLENTGDDRPTFLTFSPAQYVALAAQSGTFLTLDLVHHASLFADEYNALNEAFFQSATEMLPYVRNVHIADMNIPNHAHLPVGRGNLPVAKLLDFLAARQYAGNVIIEETGGGYSTEQFLIAAAEFRAAYSRCAMAVARC